jgi:hypothetical protein
MLEEGAPMRAERRTLVKIALGRRSELQREIDVQSRGGRDRQPAWRWLDRAVSAASGYRNLAYASGDQGKSFPQLGRSVPRARFTAPPRSGSSISNYPCLKRKSFF